MSSVEIRFTIDDPAGADRIVDALLSERLVACGQRLGPVVSRYWWQGARHEAEEWLVLLKTRTGLTSSVIDAVVALHPYDTPEVVAVAIAEGSPGYLGWIEDVTGGTGERGR